MPRKVARKGVMNCCVAGPRNQRHHRVTGNSGRAINPQKPPLREFLQGAAEIGSLFAFVNTMLTTLLFASRLMLGIAFP